MNNRRLFVPGSRAVGICVALSALAVAADPTYLRRSVPDAPAVHNELTDHSTGASYQAVFGVGDPQAAQLKGIARYGRLTVLPGGSSAIVSYTNEEQIYYVLDGQGTLLYADQKTPVKKNDFM